MGWWGVIPLTSQEVAGALGLAAFEGQVARVCTDTRLLQPDDLFLALRGESYDGNAFVPAALVSGAMAIVVEEGATIVGDAEWVRQVGGNRIYWVSDSVWALGALARAVRRKSKAMVLSITGSVGKTGTKDLLTAMSAQCGETVYTSGNENNEIGVLKTLFRLLPSTRFAVVEMGMRGEGQIKELMAVAEPDVAVVTAVAQCTLNFWATWQPWLEPRLRLCIVCRRPVLGGFQRGKISLSIMLRIAGTALCVLRYAMGWARRLLSSAWRSAETRIVRE